MDEHVHRVTKPLLDAWGAFEAGDEMISLLDLSRLCHHAADALDERVHGIPIILNRACSDLEDAYHSTEGTQHLNEGRRILESVVTSLAPDLQGQTFCDWCYGPLSATSVSASRVIGLAAEFSFACDRCIENGAYWNSPDGLEDDAVWPVDRFSPAGENQPGTGHEAGLRVGGAVGVEGDLEGARLVVDGGAIDDDAARQEGVVIVE